MTAETHEPARWNRHTDDARRRREEAEAGRAEHEDADQDSMAEAGASRPDSIDEMRDGDERHYHDD